MKILRTLAGLRTRSPTLVVDASVAVKWFLAEKDSDLAARLQSFPARFVAPDWIFAECAQAFWKRIGKSEMSVGQADFALRDLRDWFADMPSAAALVPRALAIACEINHSAYDCVYLALAEREGAKVVTVDKRFLNAAKQGGRENLVLSLREAVGGD